MIEITAMGIGMMMTAVAVAVGGLLLNASLLILGRALRAPEPTAIALDPAKNGR